MDSNTATTSGKTALVIGATGGVGSAVAAAFLQQGWRVRALTRRPEAGALMGAALVGVEWQQGDAMNQADVVRAAQGVAVIVHAANPPQYKGWRERAIPMLANAIEAARASQARLILPGNVYNFGPDAGLLLTESSPQNPRTRKGAVRVEMEQMMRQAAHQGVRSLVLRAGDFFGGHGPSSWFTTILVKPGRATRSVTFPGEREVGHAWAYMPDVAATIVRLAELDASLSAFEVFHFGGHWTPRCIEMAESIGRAVGQPNLPVRALPWPLVYMAAPFVTLLREIIEMRYLWKVPLRLDNRKLLSVLGTEPHTPLDEAVKSSLQQLGCLA